MKVPLSPWRSPERWGGLVSRWRQPGSNLAQSVARGRPAVIGQSAAVSTCVHLLSAEMPGQVQVIAGADAGRVFYRRPSSGEILHLDVFHSEGDLDPAHIAPALRKALFMAGPNFPGNPADFVDIQTGRGGGRLTGSLCYGQRQTLRETHNNHVHIAMLSSLCQPLVLPCLVAAAEWAITDQGLEIRRVEDLKVVPPGESSGNMDLTDYQDSSDSYLRSDESGQDEGERGSGASDPALMPVAVQLVDDLGGWEGAMALLEALKGGAARRRLGIRGRTASEIESALKRLERGGYVTSSEENVHLTEAGHRLARYTRLHRQEVELKLRRMVRELRQTARACLKETPFRLSLPPPGDGVEKKAVRAQAGSWRSTLAVAETVVTAATRGIQQGSARLRIAPEDLHVYRIRRHRPVDLCLLVDASASMAGQRLRAARHLVQHLLLSTRDRIAVITFQERDVEIKVPLTRNFGQLEAGLSSIQAYGLTPLAEGLERALDYLAENRRRTALLILITDGIPTVPRKGMNPLEDALNTAERVAGDRIRFTCIGLKPNQTYLKQLVERAGGSLYVLEELEEQALVAIAYREREAVGQRDSTRSFSR